MKKQFISFAFFLVLLVGISSSCDKVSLSPETELDLSISTNPDGTVNVTPSHGAVEFSMPMEENYIDHSFSRVAGERGVKLEDNVVFAYLYATKWYDEYNSLCDVLWNESDYRQWKSYIYNYQLTDMAFVYAEKWANSSDAVAVFNEVARFYKIQVYDCLARVKEYGSDMALQTDEDELYQYLSDISLAEYTPDDFQSYANGGVDDIFKPLPVLASLPDRDIYFSFASPFGAVLSINGEKFFYRWSNGTLTPRAVLPQLFLSDYDKDGEDELAVILYVGSGTGVAVTELHIVELDSMKDECVTGEMMMNLLFHRIWASYDPVADNVTVGLENQTVHVDTSHTDKEKEKEFRDIDLFNIIYFSADDGVLTVHIAVGLYGFDYATPFEYVDFYADVIYADNGMVSLANCRIEQRDT